MRTRIVASAIVAGLLWTQPQVGKAGTLPNTANKIASPARAYDVLLSNCEQVMVGVAKVMPPDKYDFTPSSLGVPNFKFNGIRNVCRTGEARGAAELRLFQQGWSNEARRGCGRDR
jgi:hypothetical protein